MLQPKGVMYEVPDNGCPNSSSSRTADVAVTIVPNTSSASGSANAPIITRASLMTMHATIPMTGISRPPARRLKRPPSLPDSSSTKRLNAYT